MKKTILVILSLLFSLSLLAQDKYLTKKGNVQFKASVPSFKPIEAKNSSVTAILNTANGDFAALVLIKGFRFKIALMEEHFNENYMESDEYPKGIFKGKIEGFSLNKLTENSKTFNLTGSLTQHGKTKNIVVPVSIKLQGQKILFDSNFKLKPEDFGIKIPKIVRKKIAREVEVNCNFELIKK
ncbi:MAG: YceI family protein [Flavobacteriaceae bacterium]|nr:YceI family protein [Flavobacteriaceae bacterium]